MSHLSTAQLLGRPPIPVNEVHTTIRGEWLFRREAGKAADWYRSLIASSGIVVMLAIALIPIAAHASTVSSPILGFSATGAFAYDATGFLGGSGTGILTTAVGTLPVGTQVDWNI